MEKLIREYTKDGFTIKVYAPDATENEKTAKQAEIREKIINLMHKEKKDTPKNV